MGGGHKSCAQSNRPQGSSESGVVTVGNTNPSGKGMNGNCYYSEGLNPTLTCNKNEGNRVAIPVLTPERANKRQNGRRFKEDGEESFTLTSQDRHGVAVDVNPQVIGGIGEKNFGNQWRQGNRVYDGDKVATALEAHTVGNTGGNSNLYSVKVEPVQLSDQSDDDGSGDVFAIDKGITPKEREIANCIESREDRGLSKRKQEGTLVCYKISECCGVSDRSMANKSESNTNPEN